ncbi:ABC transporter permease subunit [Ruminococcus flavefaciens]|uniref:ABC transporter permease subunit n=1 Tax=Ruminococcus flavefaciens TaxID=1265 RepID=UPI0013DA2069|nr:ABC transporter permease subunit [Ruminococcus flavefaciens]
MKNLLKAEFSRMFRSKLFWIFMVLSVLFSVHSIYDEATRPVMDSYSAEAYGYVFEAALYLYIMAYCFAAAVIDSLFISREHADGTVRNKIISGHSRASVYLTELIVCTVTGLIMFIVNLAIISLPFLKFGIHGMDGWVTMRRIILIAVLIIVINAMFVLFSMLISSRASSIVWTIVFMIIMLVSSGLIQDKLDNDSWSRNRREEGEYYNESEILSATERKIYKAFDRILPTDQVLNTYDIDDYLSDYKDPSTVSQKKLNTALAGICLLDAVTFAVVTTAGIALFKRKDLK